MEKIARKLTDLVGNTPLLELSNYNRSNDLKARLIVKIESLILREVLRTVLHWL